MEESKRGREKWRNILDEMRCSGEAQRSWCRERGISYHTMRSWYRKIYGRSEEKGGKPSSNWAEVQQISPQGTRKEKNSIKIKISDFELEVSEEFTDEILERVFRIIQKIC